MSEGGRESPDILFDPRVVVVVGASDAPGKWGHILARRALQSAAGRRVALVNRGGGEVLGHLAFRSLTEARAALGVPLELVCVVVPAVSLLATVTEAAASGARVVVVITAGLAELGPEGADLEARVADVARQAGVLLVGPNCLGVADTGAGFQLGHALLPPGPVSVLSQSGNVVLDIAALLAERGLGVARFVSLGNQAGLTVSRAMRACVDHPGTRAVAVYAEDVVDGPGFVAAARALVAAGKPVVLLSPGRSAAARRSAASHTGSLTSPWSIVDAVCVAAGIHRVDHPGALVDLVEGLLGPRRLAGRRIAVLTDGGGHGAMAADALTAAGLAVPALGPVSRAAVGRVLWAASTVTNPVDLAGAGDRDPTSYAEALAALLGADDVDGVLLTGYFGGYSTEPGGVLELELAAARRMAALVPAQPKPVVVHTLYPDSPTSQILRAAGIPVHRDVTRAAAVLGGLDHRPLPPLEVAPPAAPPLTDDSYEGARALLAAAGVAFPAQVTVRERAELSAALRVTGLPVVLKALGAQHKSDAGGVVLGPATAAEAHTAYDGLVERLDPPAISVEAMVPLAEGVELLVGCVSDRRFGPVVVVGVGGVLTEVLADTARALAPVSTAQARGLLLSLRCAPLLLGHRGRPPVDLAAAAVVVATLSRVAAAHPELAELEVNPLLVTPTGATALDARAVPSRPVSTTRSRRVGPS